MGHVPLNEYADELDRLKSRGIVSLHQARDALEQLLRTSLSIGLLQNAVDRLAELAPRLHLLRQRPASLPGDVVVQQATRHAWRNKSDKIARALFVMIGCHEA